MFLSIMMKIELLDLGYALVKQLSNGTTQPLTVFYELNDDSSLNLDKLVLYPRITCDVSTELSSDMGNLLALSGYVTNTGTASGACWSDTTLHAINEVIERDDESQFLLDMNMGRKSWKIFLPEEGTDERQLFDELTVGKGKNGVLFYSRLKHLSWCARHQREPNGEAELGFGCSSSLKTAIQRATTELQQIHYPISIGSAWADNGADFPDNLEKYPNMAKLASRFFDISPRTEASIISIEDSIEISSVKQLRDRGYSPMARCIWRDDIAAGSVVVSHVVVLGLETLNNLIFNQPILLLGRLRNEENIRFLLEE